MIVYNDEMYHAGIKGMHWGVRRYQNDDGSLTEAGKQRYGTRENFERERATQHANRMKNLKRAAIIGGSALALGGAAYLGATRTEVGRQAVAKGKDLVRQLIGRGLDNRGLSSKATKNISDHKPNYLGAPERIIKNRDLWREKRLSANRSFDLQKGSSNILHPSFRTGSPDLSGAKKSVKNGLLRTLQNQAMANGGYDPVIPGVRWTKKKG